MNNIPPKIFLVGFMGSGKSFLGKKLAQKLDYLFIDSDQWIEKITLLSPSEYFSKKGEPEFRKMEGIFLQQFMNTTDCVIATGGGLPAFNNHMDIMKRNGMVIYVKLSHLSLIHRLKSSQNKRPLLSGLNSKEMEGKVKSLLEEREPFYNQAHITLKGENLKIDSIIHEIEKYRLILP